MARRVVFLDRDGTINIDLGYVGSIERWQFAPRALEALRLLQDAGFTLIVVTNQSGVGRGLFSTEAVEQLHQQVRDEMLRVGVSVEHFLYCPHGPERDCDCRKPRIGMARLAERRLGEPIDYARSWTIGDKPSDVLFGINLGTRTVFLAGPESQGDRRPPADVRARDLYQAARLITSRPSGTEAYDSVSS